MIKNGLIAGVVIFLLGFLVTWLVEIIFPGIAKEYQNPAIFRPWEDPLMLAFFAYPFIFGVVSAYLWELLKGHLKGTPVNKALEFGKIYFIIATIPGMFITYTSFKLSLALVLLWTASGFLDAFIAGFVFTKLNKK